jgi:hypothetical protein
VIPDERHSRGWLGRPLEWVVAHPLLLSFVVALAARAVVATGIFVAFGGSLFPDDQTFHNLATERAEGDTAGWDKQTHALYDQTRAYVVPLTLIYEVAGSRVLAGQLFSALLGAVVAVCAARVLLEVASRGWALAGGLAAALLPSQILWSSLTLKDAAVWAVLAGLAVVVAVLNRSAGPRAAGLVGAVAALLVTLGYLRVHTLVVATWAFALSVVWGTRPWRVQRLASAAVITILLPFALGAGLAGADLVTGGLGSLGERRADNAANADTAVVDPEVWEPGIWDNLEHLPRGLQVMLIEPVPWSSGDGTGERLARMETVVWYPVLLLAVVGVAVSWQRRRAIAFAVFVGGGVCVLYALAEGNIGTAYRHRGEFVWAVILLAVLGAQRLMRGRVSRPSPLA